MYLKVVFLFHPELPTCEHQDQEDDKDKDKDMHTNKDKDKDMHTNKDKDKHIYKDTIPSSPPVVILFSASLVCVAAFLSSTWQLAKIYLSS